MIEDWLAEPGSLTARVQSRCDGDFRLRVIDERFASGASILGSNEPAEAFCREITLGCGDRPLVFARTLVPRATLAAHAWLGALGETPLGVRLFDEPGYMRGRFHVAYLRPGDALYDYVNREIVPLGDGLWARRARVELNGDPLEICECFLPGLI